MSAEEIKTLTAQLDRIERLALLSAKTILDMSEAADFTGFTTGHLYRLTSKRQIPHYKKNRKVLFKKDELERWLCERRILTEEQTAQAAETYTATHKFNRR